MEMKKMKTSTMKGIILYFPTYIFIPPTTPAYPTVYNAAIDEE